MTGSNEALQIEIDKSSPVPIYHQLQEGIKSLILQRELRPNDRIPSENEFSRQFDISPMTVRQALNGLVNEGFVYRERGRGTFVSPKYMKHPVLTGFSEDMRSRGFEPSSRIIEFAPEPASKATAGNLKIQPGDTVLRIKRLRLVNGRAVGIHTAYLRRDIDITREELEQTGSLYRLFENKNIRLMGGLDEIQAILADDQLSVLLNVDVGRALLQLTRITEDATGSPVEHVVAIYRADFYRYTARLK
jgi:GntR family transcriptional regulator